MNGNREPLSDEVLATVERLASALIDGTCSTGEQAALESLLLTSPEARDRFRTLLHTESILAWKFATPGHQSPDAVDPVGDAVQALSGANHRRRVKISRQLLIATAAIAAAVAVLVMRPAATPSQPEILTVPIAARLVDATNARWGDGRTLLLGAAVPQGPLRLLSGAAQIAFESGALVTLNGPAEIEVLGSSRLFLRSGRIVPFVPPAATGFTVVSPTGEVIDLGTEFSVNVDASGRTEVYVLDGEVDVAQGHADRGAPLRMSQGFGSRLAVDAALEVTDTPLVVDHFDEASGPLRWRDVDPTKPATVMAGALRMPIAFQQQQTGDHRGNARLVVDHDFSRMRHRRSAISFKVTLPNEGLANEHRWMGCVIDSGVGAPPMAYEVAAAVSVLISPDWQAGVRVDGEPVHQSRVFTRSDEAVGPYQVLLAIDDTAAAHERHGAAVLSVTINGQELVRNQRVSLGDQPRIGLQTFCSSENRGRGAAVIDDFSVSVSAE
jgi:hypothetical protein